MTLFAATVYGAPNPFSFEGLKVVKKPGQETGPAVITLAGKPKHLTTHATEAWPVMKGQGALVIVLHTDHQLKNYHLRYYEATSRKFRELGEVPFALARPIEATQADGSWAFVLEGTAEGKTSLVAGDTQGIRGRVDGSGARVDGTNVTFQRGQAQKSVALGDLLGSGLGGIYTATAAGATKPETVQFIKDGSAVIAQADRSFQGGHWWTDGETITFAQTGGASTIFNLKSLAAEAGIPAQTKLVVRLLTPLSSHKAKEGDAVKAVLISPALVEGKILMPQGSEFHGKLIAARGVGWGVKHETAALKLEFNEVVTTDGSKLAIHADLYQVENSRESVKKGTVQGIRSTGTPGHSAESKIASVAAVEPVAYLFTTVSATATLGFAEPEILYPAGTELIVNMQSPVVTSKAYPSAIPEFAVSAADQQKLATFVHTLPFRTSTKGSNKPSDLTNLVFVGPADGLRRALNAAGWKPVDALTADSTFQTMKSIGGNQVYNEAPMSTLLLDERPPVFALSKTTNTFSSRHHLRVFDPAAKYDGVTVLTSSSTQDIGIAFSQKQKTFIHAIDQYIDNERAKVMNDLEFTGCVEAVELVPRPWVPKEAFNATGDRLRTDGAIAVLRISDCQNPKRTPTDPAPPPNRFERVTRDTVLTIRNDVVRGNLGYQGVKGVLWAKNYFATKDQLKPDPGAWRKTDDTGTQFKGAGEAPFERQSSERLTSDEIAAAEAADASAKALEQARRWDPPHYEISVQGGYLRYPVTRQELVAYLAIPADLTNPNEQPYAGGLGDEFKGGWTAGISVTLNSWKWISNEFTYTYEKGTYQSASIFTKPVVELIEGNAGLVTRQFDYNLLIFARPPKSRWRPYAAVGPALVLTSLADAPVKKAAGPFKLGLQNIGILIAAFDFGSTPPLDGGGVFGLGLVYGGGIKFRATPHLTLKVDFRETWSRNPQFITDSYTSAYFSEEGYNSVITRGGSTGKFQQQRFTMGAAFTF